SGSVEPRDGAQLAARSLTARDRATGPYLVRREELLEPIHGARGAHGDEYIARLQNRVSGRLWHKLTVWPAQRRDDGRAGDIGQRAARAGTAGGHLHSFPPVFRCDVCDARYFWVQRQS